MLVYLTTFDVLALTRFVCIRYVSLRYTSNLLSCCFVVNPLMLRSMSALRDSPSTLCFTTLDVLSKIKPLWDYHRGFYINKGVTLARCRPTSVCACVTHKCILFLCLQICHHIHLMFYVFCSHYVS